jgi:predicted DNA-binding protein
MDTTKWKSILVPREIYEEIRSISKNEGRTISGQLRIIFEHYDRYYKKKAK